MQNRHLLFLDDLNDFATFDNDVKVVMIPVNFDRIVILLDGYSQTFYSEFIQEIYFEFIGKLASRLVIKNRTYTEYFMIGMIKEVYLVIKSDDDTETNLNLLDYLSVMEQTN